MDDRSYRPAVMVRIQARLEDFSEAPDGDAQTEAEPYGPELELLKSQDSDLTDIIGTARANGDRVAAQKLVMQQLEIRRQIARLEASEPDARYGEQGEGDVYSIDILTVPMSAAWGKGSPKSADKANVTIPFRDAPLESQNVRAALVEIYLGLVPVEDFATRDRWRLSLQQERLQFRGFVEEWETSHDAGPASVALKCKSLESVLMDTPVDPRAPEFLVHGDAEPITDYVNRVLATIPATRGVGGRSQLKAIFYRANTAEEPTLGRRTMLRGAQTAKSRNRAEGAVASDSISAVDPGQVRGAGTARIMPALPTEMSAWDLIVQACGMVGLVPTYDPSVASLDGVATEGDHILLRPPQTLYDDVDGGVRVRGGAPDGFSRFLPDPNSSGATKVRSEVRFMVWGRNVKSVRTRRALGRVKAPAVEVVSYNPDAEPAKRAIRVRFPVQKRATGISQKGTGKVDEVVRRRVYGVRDEEQLKQIAVGLYHAMGRPQLRVLIETSDLASYVDPDSGESHNAVRNADLAGAAHGTPIRFLVARQVVGENVALTPLAEVFERRTDSLRRFLLEQNARFRPSLDPETRLSIVERMVDRMSQAIQAARRTDLYYVNQIDHSWDGGKWSAKIEVMNFLEARALPKNISRDDADADQKRKIQEEVPSTDDVATSRFLKSTGV